MQTTSERKSKYFGHIMINKIYELVQLCGKRGLGRCQNSCFFIKTIICHLPELFGIDDAYTKKKNLLVQISHLFCRPMSSQCNFRFRAVELFCAFEQNRLITLVVVIGGEKRGGSLGDPCLIKAQTKVNSRDLFLYAWPSQRIGNLCY